MNFNQSYRSTRTLLIASLLIALSFTSSGLAKVRVAIVPASWNPARYYNTLNPILDNLGWEYDFYENTKIAELMPKLKTYNMVVFLTTYNFSNPQDFGKFAPQWKEYLEAGGSLVISDANYDSQTKWLSAIDKRLSLGSIRKHGRDVKADWVNLDHPLMRNVAEPKLAWGQITSWSPDWKPLAKDSQGLPYVAYQEIFDGVVVIATCYSDQEWPEANFLENLFYWAKSPQRHKALLKSPITKLDKPKLEIPSTAQTPIIDGVINSNEWSAAKSLSNFSDYITADASNCLETNCKMIAGPSDLFILFECENSNKISDLSFKKDKIIAPEREECVEVFINPFTADKPFYHFAVNALGQTFAEKMINNANQSYDQYWVAKTTHDNGKWITEIKLPFSSLGITKNAKPSKIWLANFARRHQPTSFTSQAITWTPALNAQELKSHHGLLTNIKVIADEYSIDPEIAIKTPTNWLPEANNKIDLTISNLPNSDDHANQRFLLAWRAKNSTTNSKPAQTISLQPNKTNQLQATIAVRNGETGEGCFVLYNENDTNKILASSPTITIDAKSLMTADLMMPAYRNIIQSKDPKKELLINGSIEQTELTNLKLTTAITLDGKEQQIWQNTQNIKASETFSISKTLAKLSPGKYNITLTLTSDIAAKLIHAKTDFDIEILPPSNFEVTFDERRICYVNGKAFFPIGLYHTSEIGFNAINSTSEKLGLPTKTNLQHLQDIKDHGFNTVFRTHAGPSSNESYLKLANELDLYIVPEIAMINKDQFTRLVKEANKYENVLMWYNVDEPPLTQLRFVLPKYHEMYKSIDPHRPTAAAICFHEAMPYFSKAYDIFMPDLYPFNSRRQSDALAKTANKIKLGRTASKNRMPIWLIPQAFVDDRSELIEPTPNQLSAQAYFDIIHGATGFLWYAYFETADAKNPKGRKLWCLTDSKLWPFFKKLNQEITEISPIILEGQYQGDTASTAGKIHYAIWVHDNDSYLIAVNPYNEKASATFENIQASSVEVLLENRKLTPSGNNLKDTFEPYQRHIYKYSTDD